MNIPEPKPGELLLIALLRDPILAKHEHCIFTGAELLRRKRLHVVRTVNAGLCLTTGARILERASTPKGTVKPLANRKEIARGR